MRVCVRVWCMTATLTPNEGQAGVYAYSTLNAKHVRQKKKKSGAGGVGSETLMGLGPPGGTKQRSKEDAGQAHQLPTHAIHKAYTLI